jgi:rod shape-determining protein MreC
MEERRGTLLLVGLILLHLVAISHQVDRGGVSLLETIVFAAVSPVQNVVAGGVHGVKNAWFGYVDLRHVRAENTRLRERNRDLEVALQEKEHLAGEAARLRQIAGLQQLLPMETIVAQVVARDGMPWFRVLTINRGSADGVALDAPVLAPTGVVGRIIGVGGHAAKVQLLLDRHAGVQVQVVRNDVTLATGVTEGLVGLADSSSRDLVLKYVPSLADVAVGDKVLTAGLDQIYPKGLTVGRVSGLGSADGLFKEIYVTPSAQFDQIEEVLVVKSQTQALDITDKVTDAHR